MKRYCVLAAKLAALKLHSWPSRQGDVLQILTSATGMRLSVSLQNGEILFQDK